MDPRLRKVIKSIIKWNKARYVREYNGELVHALLQEEKQEYLDAIDDIERADALGDVFYVTVGGLWKGGLSSDRIMVLLATYVENPNLLQESPDSAAMALGIAMASAYKDLSSLAKSDKKATDILIEICKSNNTKLSGKIASDEKYCADGKGPNFRPPEAAIQLILETP